MARPRPGRTTLAELVSLTGAELARSGGGPEPDAVVSALRRVLHTRGLRWDDVKVARAARRVADALSGLGPVGPLVRDPGVSEVMINGPGEVFVERSGRLERTEVVFASADEVWHLIERVV